jgi:Ni2+-binding GTPase involved in maturation of urease and hydrogenase
VLKSRYIMVGGFLGAGKTTAILQLARQINQKNLRVGLITNDQSSGLVDTAMLRSSGFSTEEITGGCFCCRFNSLVDAAGKLQADTHPDVFIAEPVGSCTDLQATVAYPLRKMYGDNYTIAPLSVVLDPLRTARILGLEQGKSFSPKVRYIFEKQLEEADILVINKCDLIDEEKQNALQTALNDRFPRIRVLRISARSGAGISEWLELLLKNEAVQADPMDVDYDVYAEGEALLGWLNLSAALTGSEFNGNEFLTSLGNDLCVRLNASDIEIAHLKMTFSPDSGNDLAAGNLVRNQGRVELSHELAEPVEEGFLLLNLRAEGDPDILKQQVEEELSKLALKFGLEVIVENLEAFRPGRPEPTHRMV